MGLSNKSIEGIKNRKLDVFFILKKFLVILSFFFIFIVRISLIFWVV